MAITDIKAAIKAHLDALVTAGVLRFAASSDVRHDPLAADHPAFPAAYLMPPGMESQVLDNRTVLRTYTFDILLVENGENVQDVAQLEALVEAVIGEFDNDPTLGGQARGGVLPVSASPRPFQHNGKDLFAIYVQIVAKQDVTLTFSS